MSHCVAAIGNDADLIRISEQPFSQSAVMSVFCLKSAAGFHDICVVANGPFARAKEIKWPTGKTRKRPA